LLKENWHCRINLPQVPLAGQFGKPPGSTCTST
jgi:hypothetical protein